MTGIFCHYLPIYKDKNGNYCSTTLTNDLFKRYLRVVEKLYVLTRVYNVNSTYEEMHQEKIDVPGVEVVDFPNLSSPKRFIHLKKYKKIIFKYINESDLVFIRGGLIADLAAKYSQKIKKPYLFECAYCSFDDYWNHGIVGKFIAPFMELRQKNIAKNAAYVIYVTEKWLQKRYPTKGCFTYASNVYLDGFDDNVLANKKIRNEQLNKRTILVGTIGGIDNKAKGHRFVLKAMKLLKEKYDLDINYEIVGSGEGTTLKAIAVKNKVDNHFFIKGQMTHIEIMNWLDNIDIYIQPSLQEGLPRSLIEAMSRGCLAIGSSTAGIPELLPEKYVFERGKYKDLAHKLFDLINSEDKDKASYANFIKSKEYNLSDLNARRNHIYDLYNLKVEESKN